MDEQMDDAYSWQAKYLAITPKPFAILSICGSVCIIKHILSSPKHLVKTSTFARILFALSIFDFMTSCGVFMGTWPIPRGTPGVYMASGNKGTCTGKNYYIICNMYYPFMTHNTIRFISCSSGILDAARSRSSFV